MQTKLIVLSSFYVLIGFFHLDAQEVTDSVLIKSFNEHFLKMDTLISPPHFL